jgi:hypothetical protein
MATTTTTTTTAITEAPPAPLKLAKPGDQLTPDDLAGAFRFLMDQAKALDDDVKNAPDVDTQQSIGRVQNELIKRAAALNAKSIDLLAGQARIAAEHINSAVTAAKSVIEKVADIKGKLAKLGAVLDFFGAVLTGNGRAILEGAHTLRDALGKP